MPGAWSRLLPAGLTLLFLSLAIGSTYLSSIEDDVPDPPAASQVLNLPEFQPSDHLLVVNVTTSSFAERLTLSGLQGLVNREQSRVYLDREGELADMDRSGGSNLARGNLLSFILLRYELSHEELSPTAFLSNFSEHATGLVVYDPEMETTVNVARTLAGQEDLLIVHPDQLVSVADVTGLTVKHDLREGPWEGLSALDMQELAFDRYYQANELQPLVSTVTDRELITDYGVALGAFWFHLNPGPFTLPGEMGLYEKFMRESKPGVPMFGWFDQPTGVEENRGIQVASHYGHYFIGGELVPNISLLTAHGRNDISEPAVLSEPLEVPELEAKTYVSFAVSDGDNLQFFTQKGRDIWNQPQRGRLPLAWSVSPALAELAPPLLERTYLEATPRDTFIAGPSGLGYFYPGFLPEGHLTPLLWRTGLLMDQSHLDSVWLLNSFTTYETPYAEEDLETYVEVLEPQGMLLDYGDVPLTEPYWQQGEGQEQGEQASAPVVRVYHLWGSVDNLLAKLEISWGENRPAETGVPHFTVVALMSIDFDLEEIWEVYTTLAADREFEVVGLPAMFELVDQHWEMRQGVEAANEPPFLELYEGDPGPEGASSYDSYVRYRSETRGVQVNHLLNLLILALAFSLPLLLYGRKREEMVQWTKLTWPQAYDKLFSGFFYLGLWYTGLWCTDRLLNSNFWHYGWLFLGFGLAWLIPGLWGRYRHKFTTTSPGKAILLGSALLASLGLFKLHPLGFLPLFGLFHLSWRFHVRRNGMAPWNLIASLGLALGLLALTKPLGWWPLLFTTPLLVFGLLHVAQRGMDEFEGTKEQKAPKLAWPLPSYLLTLLSIPLATLPWYLDRSFFWTNHVHFRVLYLEGLAVSLPVMALLLLASWRVFLGTLVQNEPPAYQRARRWFMKRPPFSPALFYIGMGLWIFLAAAGSQREGYLHIGLLLLFAQIFWLGAAYKALDPGVQVRSVTEDLRNPHLKRFFGSTISLEHLFLLALGCQALLALQLTLPPVFYSAFVWPHAPRWVLHFLYVWPLQLSLLVFLVFIPGLVGRAWLYKRSQRYKPEAST